MCRNAFVSVSRNKGDIVESGMPVIAYRITGEVLTVWLRETEDMGGVPRGAGYTWVQDQSVGNPTQPDSLTTLLVNAVMCAQARVMRVRYSAQLRLAVVELVGYNSDWWSDIGRLGHVCRMITDWSNGTHVPGAPFETILVSSGSRGLSKSIQARLR